MKKIILFLFAILLSGSIYAQQGDLSFGVKGSYVTVYKDLLYGLDLSYHIADPLEISISQLINPSVTKEDEFNSEYDEKLGLYSTNLDLRYYLLLQRSWATGPILGGQYLFVKNKESDIYNINAFGFNIGWHLRINLTDHLKINGSWRYTNGQDETSHHAFSLGLCYTINLF